jgi:hypothetical protein
MTSITQQKIPSTKASDQDITSAMANLDKYIKEGWSIPADESSKFMTTATFIETVWEPMKATTPNQRELLTKLHEWMAKQQVLESSTKFYDGLDWKEGCFHKTAPVKRHVSNFHSGRFFTMSYNILKNFTKYFSDNKVIKPGDYFIDHSSNCIIFINSVKSNPKFDQTAEELYSCILYCNDSEPIGRVDSKGPSNEYNNNQSYICVEDIGGSRHLKKCYESEEGYIPTKYWSFSVKKIKDNSKLDFTNTFVGCCKQVGSREVRHDISKYDKEILFIISNAFAISEQSLKTKYIGEYLGVDGAKMLKKGGKYNLRLQEWFIDNIDLIFEKKGFEKIYEFFVNVEKIIK